MRLPPRLLGAAILTMSSLIAAPAFAGDAVKVDGLKYSDEVTVIGLKNGQLQISIKGNDKLFDLDKVEWINLDRQDNFNKAETNRKDAKAAAAAYKTAIGNINDRKLKVLAQLRAVGPTDADGKYLDAVNYFLDAYQASPTDSVWKLHPTNMPPAASTMLKESATKIESRVPAFSADQARKNLETWELELLTKANDPARTALARKLGTGIAEPAANAAHAASQAPSAPVPVVVSGRGLEGVVSELNARHYDNAIALADKELATAIGSTAIQLFNLKAQAYEAKQGDLNLSLAAATYLRIPAHYPSSGEAPIAMLHAADLQKRLKRDDEAKRLYKEIIDTYPNSAAAVRAKAQG